MIVDYDGRLLAQADPGPGEKIVVAPIDIGGLRHARQRRRGHDLRSHLRTRGERERRAGVGVGWGECEVEVSTGRSATRVMTVERWSIDGVE